MSSFVGTNRPDWQDMSDDVVHFTNDHGASNAYSNMLAILAHRRIEARNPFGIARSLAPVPDSQRCVCFSEVPPHQIGRLAQARSSYGIGFSKAFAVHRGANPIVYAYKDGPLHSAFRSMMNEGTGDSEAAIWDATPFVDVPGTYGSRKYFFEWEREWRVRGDFNFAVEDVSFLIIPEELHDLARQFFETARDENLGPSYDCPFIDPHWTLTQVRAALR